MKKFIIYIVFAVLLSACTDSLDLAPISSKNVDNFYKTEAQFTQAINGCYDGMQGAFVNSHYSYSLSESRSDNAWQSIDNNDGLTCRFLEDASLPVFNSCWAGLYKYIARCNNILSSIDGDIELNGDIKNQFKGEALFMRALFHFELVRYFGEVPIVDKILTIDEGYALNKSSVEAVYDFIVKDLKEAIALLPDVKPSDMPNKATVLAARGFLGKVYVFRSGYPLNKNEWSLASTELKAVLDGIGSGGFFDEYNDIFSYSNENGDQAVFSIGFKAGASGEGNGFPTRNAPNGIKPGEDTLTIRYGGSPYQLYLDQFIVNSLFDEPGDKRKDYAVQEVWQNKADVLISHLPFSRKYQNGPVGAAYDWDIDWILLRYTDVYMLYGEAQYHLGNKSVALDILNKVRMRAGLAELAASSIDTQDKFVNLLLKERRKEFCFENQRWFDLVRTDKALELMMPFLANYGSQGVFTSKEQYYFPIPAQETNITGIQ